MNEGKKMEDSLYFLAVFLCEYIQNSKFAGLLPDSQNVLVEEIKVRF